MISNNSKEEMHCGMHQSCVDKLNYQPCGNKDCCHVYILARQSKVETTVFNDDQNVESKYMFPKSSPDFVTDKADEELGDFIKRPVLIKTITWVPTGVTDADWDPWTAYLKSAFLAQKLHNFAYFRGNLHLKVVINSTPFNYGCMRLAYTPCPPFTNVIDNTSATALVPYSQRPGMWLDLRSNVGGEMVLPFIWHKNMIRISGTAGTARIAELGRMRNITYVGLASANGTTVKPVTIKIYAWMEDVTLTGNTYDYALQSSKKIVDEYGVGPISRSATAVASWASYLVNVPVIGTYAKATQIAASATSSVAGLFGWTKVPVISNTEPIKISQYRGLSSSSICQPTEKMTLDPKAELSVDPKIVGPLSGRDELSVSYLVQRESYLTSMIWSSNDADRTVLQRFRVTPSLKNVGSASGGVNKIGYTPSAYIAEMFSCWRGDLIFTIRVICSQYHRGRLQLTWDPMSTSSSTSYISETTLNRIIDIGETTEYEFRVPYIKDNMWAKTSVDPSEILYDVASPLVALNDDYHNGTLRLLVSSQLSAPTDSTSVTVMVFVRGAENLEFANPRAINNACYLMTPQSKIDEIKAVNSEEDKILGSTPLDERYLVTFGEAIPSLRVLLQRASLFETLCPAFAYGNEETHLLMKYAHSHTRFPSPPGNDGIAYTKALSLTVPATYYSFRYCNMVPLTWIAHMFVARRGSVQWHYQLSDITRSVRNFQVRRSPDITISASEAKQYFLAHDMVPDQTVNSVAEIAKWQRASNDAVSSGFALSDNLVNGALSIECPQMSRCRFQYCGDQYSAMGFSEDESNLETYTVSFDSVCDTDALGIVTLYKYVNIGTDFSLSFFLNVPQVYYSPTAGATPEPKST